MKKFIILGLVLNLLALPLCLMADPPDPNTHGQSAITDTVDVDWSTTTWEFIDSIVMPQTDTCFVFYTAVGTAVIDPGNTLYLGWNHNGGSPTGIPDDTSIFSCPFSSRQPLTVEFGLTFKDSLISQTDVTDTLYFVGAVSGSAGPQRVIISSVVVTGIIADTSGF